MAMLGVFLARDVLLFYVFFELTLMPMFFIIGIWGGPERRYAAGKFFLFTFTGSVFTLAGVVYLGMQAGTFDLTKVTQFAQTHLTANRALLDFPRLPRRLQREGAAVPRAHLAAAGPHRSTDGGLGHSRRRAAQARHVRPAAICRADGIAGCDESTSRRFLGVLCLIGIIYGALVAWVQQDIKKLVAYSSVSHLGFCVLGLIALNDDRHPGLA